MSAIRKFSSFFIPSLILIAFFMGGCSPKFDSFIEGEYISTNEVENDMISKIKLDLYHIDEQTYIEANGVNVVSDFTRSGEDQYFSFDLYFYIDELEEYRKIDLTNFEHESHAYTYYCYSVDKEASYQIYAITFWFVAGAYDTWFEVWFSQNGVEYGYQATLVANIE